MDKVSDLLSGHPSLARPRRGRGGQRDSAQTMLPGVEATPLEQQLIASSADIQQREPLLSELSYMARHLVQVTLPHRDPGEVALWTRTNGDVTLVIGRTGIDEKGQPVGYPYGTIPRLLLYWMTREAVRTKRRQLELGQNLASFMRAIGLNPNSGRGVRSDAHRLRDQMLRLFSSSIGFQYTRHVQGMVGQQTQGMLIAPRRELWWDPKNVRQGMLWQSWIELGEEFYQAVTTSVIPIDMRALKAIKNSPLALDLYGWATYKTYSLYRKGQPQVVSYQEFMNQFGTDYSDRRNFKRKLIAALEKVRHVYPELKMETVTGGLKIYPSRPAVAPPE